jgi:hypothetical protein
MIWTVVGLLAAGRFVEFFMRSDSATLALLETAQWTSLAIVAAAAVGAWLALARGRRAGSTDRRR